ncbi:hypothetical protein AAEX37_00678 [Oligella sp. MSHR50489EDL]|uniref:cache domain-containing protein n=1 Tax=Oligella sp. MSHR50489EDL TaxID=3139409 RepID=UPI003D819FCB
MTKFTKRGALVGALVCAFSAVATAQNQSPSAESDTVEIIKANEITRERAERLLTKAVEHIQDKGLSGVNDFNNKESFTDKDLYVFSLSTEGVLLASGGWSAGMVGDNVLNYTDSAGSLFFQDIVDIAKTEGAGEVEYQWYSMSLGREENKLTHFKVVDDIIVAVGYTPDISTDSEVINLLKQAVTEYRKNPIAAMRKFRNYQSGFRNPDKYIFVLDTKNRQIVFAPSQRDLDDTPLDKVLDVQGKAFLTKIADTAKSDEILSEEYWWFSSRTKQVEKRHAYYQLIDDDVIAVSSFITNQ